MPPPELCLDSFLQFLADRPFEVVGYSGVSFFRNPLAEWLSLSCGCLVAVDTDSYSYVFSSCSRPLPCWARRLVAWLEACSPAPLTGEMVFTTLAQLEAGARLPRF